MIAIRAELSWSVTGQQGVRDLLQGTWHNSARAEPISIEGVELFTCADAA
jgi:hypothetical protein